MLQIGWIDFSKEHRNRVMSVIDMLSKPGAVDELGISVIRDRFSDIFFPGTSTIQTRAKYFFIVPWILSELEREKGLKLVDYSKRLHNEEVGLIEILERDGEWGVIGTDSREKLKRKPSSIYWNGLKTFNIFKYPKLSLSEYIPNALHLRAAKEKEEGELKLEDKEERNSKDDRDALRDNSVSSFWSTLKPIDGWRDSITLKLTEAEAEFLRDKILTSPYSKDSLFAYILENYGEEIMDCNSFLDLEDFIFNMPESIYRDYKLAKDFSRLIYGAHIRYNILFFKASGSPQNDLYMLWDMWKGEIQNNFDFNEWNCEELFYRLRVNDDRLKGFVRKWTEYARNINSISIEEIDDFIIKREISLKGVERSKLKNADEYTANNGRWIGIDVLEYRWTSARRILRDIYEGLGEEVDKAR